MRFLLFTVALISAFFSYGQTIDPFDLVPAEPHTFTGVTYCKYNGQPSFDVAGTDYSVCLQSTTEEGVGGYAGYTYVFAEEIVTQDDSQYKKVAFKFTATVTTSSAWQQHQYLYHADVHKTAIVDGYICPPVSYPEHTIKVDSNGQTMCAKLFEPDNDDSCPSITDDSLSILNFTVDSSDYACFDNPNGPGQCAYSVENGMYRIPPELGSSEGVKCDTQEPLPEEPIEPDPDGCYQTTNGQYCKADPDDKCSVFTDTLTGDSYNKCASNCGYIDDLFACVDDGSQPTETPPIVDTDENGTLDDSELSTAIGQLIGTAQEGNRLTNEGNKLLKSIGDKIDQLDDPEASFTVTAERKTGPLSDYFTESDMHALSEKIETARTDLTDYWGTIQSEASEFITFGSPPVGDYESRPLNIKGQAVDISLSRFRESFQTIAPVLLFIATVMAVFILLGSNRE
ncbi:hypothetical protein [Pseudoalteromonas sp. T1lg22]|uniref:hypothetical protein n=1 Tax=Pseudoalteromonas sp. T1lg22 TaxID=2077096 RepID=UPI000CF69725|nr:hypothetical protein [Pseudoalteromonas sp. T1lg22]